MFPRDARKTRRTSRSSSVRTQNSHEVNAPDSSVEHSGHVSRVVARRWLQTGQLDGGLRVVDLAIYSTAIRMVPIVQSQSRVPAPDPMVNSLLPGGSTFSHGISPSVVRALRRTLEVLSRTTRTSPIWQRIALAPLSRWPFAVTFPAVTLRFIGPRKSAMSQLPAWTSAVTAP